MSAFFVSFSLNRFDESPSEHQRSYQTAIWKNKTEALTADWKHCSLFKDGSKQIYVNQ